jgi:FtsP/CotA-like multicopper oxidase with cupredoxin domain
VRSGERIRLRLITGLSPQIIAVDGQAIIPYETTEPIVVGAAGRVDLILDMLGKPGTSSTVVDSFYRQSFDLTRFVYDKAPPLRESKPSWPIALDSNKLPEPDLDNALVKTVVIAGGAMGGLQRAKLDGQWMSLREIAEKGYVWALNDIIGTKPDMPPLIDVKQNTTVRPNIENHTVFSHPMHLHGHHMKLLSINGQAQSDTRWVDSPLLMPDQRMDFAFVADNPGDWLFHCHALEHHAAGLGALVKVR